MRYTQEFLNKSNPSYASNRLLKGNKRYKTKVFVEGIDDEIFYRKFLSDRYDIQLSNQSDVRGSIKCNKESVILNVRGIPNCRGIVDRDYDYNNHLPDRIALTSGYSLENFYFYKNDSIDNLPLVLKLVAKNNYFNLLLAEVKEKLKSYVDEFIYYYAFFKTLIENKINIPRSFKNSKINKSNIINNIEIILSKYCPYEREKYEARFKKNIEIIRENNLMLIRGHDLINHLATVINSSDYSNVHNIDARYLINHGEVIKLPADFLREFDYAKN